MKYREFSKYRKTFISVLGKGRLAGGFTSFRTDHLGRVQRTNLRAAVQAEGPSARPACTMQKRCSGATWSQQERTLGPPLQRQTAHHSGRRAGGPSSGSPVWGCPCSRQCGAWSLYATSGDSPVAYTKPPASGRPYRRGR